MSIAGADPRLPKSRDTLDAPHRQTLHRALTAYSVALTQRVSTASAAGDESAAAKALAEREQVDHLKAMFWNG